MGHELGQSVVGRKKGAFGWSLRWPRPWR